MDSPCLVLIESDWNLKYDARKTMLELLRVLIESDWNLKCSNPVMIKIGGHSINRIRLEFKGRAKIC